MPVSRRYTAHLPIATGYVTRDRATGALYPLAQFLQRDRFWRAQIEQIHILADCDVLLVPRVGSHHILLGSVDDYRAKLANLRLFYRQAMPRFGWETYSLINLKFHNQIVCTIK
jgi:cell division protein FtsQ